MLDTSARLLRLLSLFQARRYWSGADLSVRLAVTARTLRRDVDRLRSLGYPVNSTSGTAGGYQLGQVATLPPLLLDDDEAVAVAVGLRTAASGTVTGIEEASVRALSKLQQLLPEGLRRRVTALQSFIVPLASTGPTVDGESLAVIAGACRDSERLEFAYRSREGVASKRQVEPSPRWCITAAVVPAAWGCRPCRLANVPCGPDRGRTRHGSPVTATARAGRRFQRPTWPEAYRTDRRRIGRRSRCTCRRRRPRSACLQGLEHSK